MRPELVLFDLDGVLVDSETLSIAAILDQLRPLGLDLSPQEARSDWLGMSWPDLFSTIERRLGRPLPDGFGRAVIDRERAVFRERLQPVPGARAMLRALAAAGQRRCVASSEEPEGIVLKLEATGLANLIDGGLYSASMVERGKPAPDLVLHAARSEGVDPARCAVIEDAPFGVQGAVAAGMAAYGYAGDEHADPEALRAAGATVFTRMAALPGLLGL